METYKRGGKLIVPAFAVGRTQELVYRLHQLVDSARYSSRTCPCLSTARWRSTPRPFTACTPKRMTKK